MHKTGQTSKSINDVFLLEVVWWLKENYEYHRSFCISMGERTFMLQLFAYLPPWDYSAKSCKYAKQINQFPKVTCTEKGSVC